MTSVVRIQGGEREECPTSTGQSNPQCRFKRTINDHGDRIDHLPGDPRYAWIKLDATTGERWFCSEKEALTAGWRPPRK